MKIKVLVINGVDAIIFNKVPKVRVENSDCEKVSLQDYIISTITSNMDYDGIYNHCEYRIEEREVK